MHDHNISKGCRVPTRVLLYSFCVYFLCVSFLFLIFRGTPSYARLGNSASTWHGVLWFIAGHLFCTPCSVHVPWLGSNLARLTSFASLTFTAVCYSCFCLLVFGGILETSWNTGYAEHKSQKYSQNVSPCVIIIHCTLCSVCRCIDHWLTGWFPYYTASDQYSM